MPLNPIGRKSPLLCLKVLSHYARRRALTGAVRTRL